MLSNIENIVVLSGGSGNDAILKALLDMGYTDKNIRVIVNAYDDEVKLYHFIDILIPYVPKIINYINIVIIACSIALFVLLILLIIVKYRYYSATIMASGLIILFVRLVIIEKIDVLG